MALDELAAKQAVLAWLERIMPGTEYVIRDPRANDLATALAAKQNERWRRMYDLFSGNDAAILNFRRQLSFIQNANVSCCRFG